MPINAKTHMTKSKRIFFIILEFLSGLGFGILGTYIFSFFDKWDLLDSVLFTFMALFASMLTGIGLVGYVYLKRINKLSEFVISMVLSFVGLIIFLLLYIMLSSLIPYLTFYKLNPLLAIVLPMTGAVIGFNFKTRHVILQGTKKQLSADGDNSEKRDQIPPEKS
jgi:uncharacterized protein YacL